VAPPLRIFLERAGADPDARYTGFGWANGYYEGIDMTTALDLQEVMAFRLSGAVLLTKLGFKKPKFVTAFYVTNVEPRGYWTNRGYNWFSGI
jgi:DMSO/TMAO reductase YedYZ molybdopterin-dependent catalytic subunit